MSLFGDIFDAVTRVGACFNWIEPLANEIGGFTNVIDAGNPANAAALRKQLEADGMVTRQEYNPITDTIFVSYRKR